MVFMRLIWILFILLLILIPSSYADSLAIGKGGNEILIDRVRRDGPINPAQYCAGANFSGYETRDDYGTILWTCPDETRVTMGLIKDYANRLKFAEQKINEMETLYSKRIEKLLKDIEILTNSLDSLNKRIDKN